MFYWWFMFISVMLIPAILFLFGKFFSKDVPMGINSFCGYRTKRSMKNENTWVFANKYWGALAAKLAVLSAALTARAMALVYNGDEGAVTTVASIAAAIQVVLLIVSVILTEKALKTTFDKEGNPIGKI